MLLICRLYGREFVNLTRHKRQNQQIKTKIKPNTKKKISCQLAKNKNLLFTPSFFFERTFPNVYLKN